MLQILFIGGPSSQYVLPSGHALNTDFSSLCGKKRAGVEQACRRFLPFFYEQISEILKTLQENPKKRITWKKDRTGLPHSFQARLSGGGKLTLFFPLLGQKIKGCEKTFTLKVALSTSRPLELEGQLRANRIKGPTEEEAKENALCEQSFRLDTVLLQEMYPKMRIKPKECWHNDRLCLRTISPVHEGDLLTLINEIDQRSENFLFIICKVLHHLSRLHDLGRAHMDLKPENILKTDNDDWIIIDFGFSCPFNAPSPKYGTLGYLAPEVLFASTETITPTPQIDMWGVGVIILFLVNPSLFDTLCDTQTELYELLRDNINPLINTSLALQEYLGSLETIQRELKKGSFLERMCADIFFVDPNRRPTLPELIKRCEIQALP